MRLIGLAARAGSGKDLVAEYLERYHGFRRYAFADPMRAMVHALEDYGVFFPRDRESPAVSGISERQMLQDVGGLGRSWRETFWIHVAALSIFPMDKDTVVSDVRTEGEAFWIRELGGEIWHIYRPDAEPVRQDVTEKGIISDGELVIVNDGTIQDLYDEIDEILEAEDEEIYGLTEETKARMEHAAPKDYVGAEVIE